MPCQKNSLGGEHYGLETELLTPIKQDPKAPFLVIWVWGALPSPWVLIC